MRGSDVRFNSKLVRLDAEISSGTPFMKMFQFQTGAIRSAYIIPCCPSWHCFGFNSKLVRLEERISYTAKDTSRSS